DSKSCTGFQRHSLQNPASSGHQPLRCPFWTLLSCTHPTPFSWLSDVVLFHNNQSSFFQSCFLTKTNLSKPFPPPPLQRFQQYYGLVHLCTGYWFSALRGFRLCIS